MPYKTFSTYEAKARFSELLRLVRERGETVAISYHGEPVAEIRPLAARDVDPLRDRVQRLEERGVIARVAGGVKGRLGELARRPGALERFLKDRGP